MLCVSQVCVTQRETGKRPYWLKWRKVEGNKKESPDREEAENASRVERRRENDRQFISKKEAVFPALFFLPFAFPPFYCLWILLSIPLHETSFLFPFFLFFFFFFATPSLDTSFASAVFRFPLNPSSAARVTILSISLFFPSLFLFFNFFDFFEILNLSPTRDSSLTHSVLLFFFWSKHTYERSSCAEPGRRFSRRTSSFLCVGRIIYYSLHSLGCRPERRKWKEWIRIQRKRQKRDQRQQSVNCAPGSASTRFFTESVKETSVSHTYT